MDAVIRSHYQHVSLGYFQHQSIVRRYNWLKPAGTENVPLPFSFLANRGESTADRSRHNVTVSNDFRLLVKHTQIFIVLKVTRTQSSCPPTRKRGFSVCLLSPGVLCSSSCFPPTDDNKPNTDTSLCTCDNPRPLRPFATGHRGFPV